MPSFWVKHPQLRILGARSPSLALSLSLSLLLSPSGSLRGLRLFGVSSHQEAESASVAVLCSPLVSGNISRSSVSLALISWHVLMCPRYPCVSGDQIYQSYSFHVQVQVSHPTGNHHKPTPASTQPVASLGKDTPELWPRALLPTPHWPESGHP